MPEISGDFATLMEWADEVRTLKVRTNADTPQDAAKARSFGAEGIGLCRTEHMFFEGQRIVDMRKMILADDEAGRKAALAALAPYQRDDFVGIFEAMAGLPVTIRLLDPPLHEFLPHDEAGQAEVARQLGIPVEKVRRRVEQLHESNPMLGLRGCRLPIKYPEIGDMQVRAIIEAAIEVKKRGKEVLPEIMIPLVGTVEELAFLKKRAVAVADEVMAKAGVKVDYLIGTMIEIPRAALTADQIAEEAQFFSFGTNDLTQMTFGFSRDDITSFVPVYVENKILKVDPFQTLDIVGVGQLVEMGVTKGRADPQGQGRAPQDRHLRRARRRPREHRLLPQGGHGLRLVLPLPRADRPPGRRAGGPRRRPDDQPRPLRAVVRPPRTGGQGLDREAPSLAWTHAPPPHPRGERGAIMGIPLAAFFSGRLSPRQAGSVIPLMRPSILTGLIGLSPISPVPLPRSFPLRIRRFFATLSRIPHVENALEAAVARRRPIGWSPIGVEAISGATLSWRSKAEIGPRSSSSAG